jgi:hypothetical protein
VSVDTLKSVRAELVEAPLFAVDASKEEQPFDKLRANGSVGQA